MSRADQHDWNAEPLGAEPDLWIARRVGVAPGTVSSARRRRGIPVCPLPRGTVERLGGVDMLGQGRTDAEVADALGCGVGAVREARRRHGVPSTEDRYDWDTIPLGEDWDLHVAQRYSVSVAQVCDARRRRGIPRYAPEVECPCGATFRARFGSQQYCGEPCLNAAHAARHSGRDGDVVTLYVALSAVRRAIRSHAP